MVPHTSEALIQRGLAVILYLLTFATFGLLIHNWYLGRSLARVITDTNYETPLEYGDRVDPNALRHALQQAGYPRSDPSLPPHLLLIYSCVPHISVI